MGNGAYVMVYGFIVVLTAAVFGIWELFSLVFPHSGFFRKQNLAKKQRSQKKLSINGI